MTITVDVNTILAAPRLLLADDDGGQNCRVRDRRTRGQEGERGAGTASNKRKQRK
jgi:hypothetical protein